MDERPDPVRAVPAASRPTHLSRRALLGAGAALSGVAVVGVGEMAHAEPYSAPADRPPVGVTPVQLLSITDFHGYLQPTDLDGYQLITDRGQQRVVGGVQYLASHLRRLRHGQRNSVFFSAGDNFSGWPFLVDAHANEPTIEVLNALGLDFTTVGNHELDQTFPDYLVDHIQRAKPYGRAGVESQFVDSTGKRFRGADFGFMTANVVDADTGRSVQPAWNIVEVDAGRGRRHKVGFVHLTVTDTAVGTTSYQPQMKVLDYLPTANAAAEELHRRGASAIVVVMHEGCSGGPDINGLSNAKGPAFDLAQQASPLINAFVTGHWHATFNGMVPGPDGVRRPLVEAGCHGQAINEITLYLDSDTGALRRDLTTSITHANSHDIAPDLEVAAICRYWVEKGVTRWNEPLSRLTGDITRARTATGESSLGNLGADILFDEARDGGDDVDLALFAVGPRKGSVALSGDGLLVRKGGSPGDSDGRVLLGEIWSTFGYGNPVLGVTVKGSQVAAALADQWRPAGATGASLAPLAVSSNVTYDVDLAAPPAHRVKVETIAINGKRLDPDADYRVAAFPYTLNGSDGTTGLAEFTRAVRHRRDREAAHAYLRRHPLLNPPATDRARDVTTQEKQR